MTADINELRRRMDGALKSLHTEFGSLRTGRANAAMLDNIMVDAYGAMMPLNQVSTISVPEARLLVVNVWDKGVVKSVEKAINAAGLGINAVADGQMVRVPIPELSQERRTELTKVAGKYAEGGKVAIRNVRRDGMEGLKKLHKDGDISEDEQKKREGDIQKLTDEFIKKIDEALAAKEKEILGN
ncbi:MAG: ribosome recycling factor [Alphaproteobacteria bacterium]|nr:ribosome recycling factor [Alphaproteobacteria bacterium]